MSPPGHDGQEPDARDPQRREPDERLVNESNEPPPFLGSWPRVYAVVLGWLALLIALFALFTRAFS